MKGPDAAKYPKGAYLLVNVAHFWVCRIKQNAYACGMLIDRYTFLLDTSERKAHMTQLQKIGVNQIARRINETGRISSSDIDKIKRMGELD